MLKVGVSEAVDPHLRELLPKAIELEVIPLSPEREIEVEFWIVPPFYRHAKDAWPHLRGVRVAQSCMGGVDFLLKLLPRDLILCDARGVHTISTAEWAMAAILAAYKYLPFFGEVRRSGQWSRRREAEEHYRGIHHTEKHFYPPVLLEELHGQRVLIVGYGSIGEAIEQRLLPFGVQIDRVARCPRAGVFGVDKLPDLLPQADVVVLAVPQTSETAGMIGKEQIAAMKPGALLVNAARGPVVNTDALVAALEAGHIRAALDVTDPEPLPEGHPLWKAPNLLVTPHVAGSTPMFMTRAMRFAAEQIERYLKGDPLENVVTGEY
jgi:phosphoglycerate dehydrogenase-like enzyme